MRAYEDFEIVYVGQDACLYDAESRPQSYRRRDGWSLDRGYYVVSWPSGTGDQRYDEKAVFRGPFKRYQDAETNLRNFLVLLQGQQVSGQLGGTPGVGLEGQKQLASRV